MEEKAFSRRWIAGSSPAMTARGESFRDTISVRFAELPDVLLGQNLARAVDTGSVGLGLSTGLRKA
jgi:hypothetical protein